MAVASSQRPMRLVIRDDDLRRSRLTVFFRLILAIPHLVWLLLWGIAAFVVAFALWLAILIEGKAPTILHDFVAGYLRYATHVGSYLYLAASPYPGFRGRPGYPVDLEIDPPERQSRWTAFFRLFLALPALLLTAVLGGGLSVGSQGGSWGSASGEPSNAAWTGVTVAGTAAAAAFLAWLAILALGHAPRGLRDLIAYALGYGAQTGGYLLLLTGRYPSSDPVLAEPYAELPEHPVRIVVADDLERPRLMVLFRLFLAIPHFVWLLLWSVATFVAAVAAWIAALATGRVPPALHRFLAAYVRYVLHLLSFLHLVGRKFPGFTGRAGSYGIDLQIDPRARQSRWKILFRLLLALPALLLGGVLGGVVLVVAFLGWFYAIVTGSMPEGLRNLGASCLRYGAQLDSYLLLLTDRYPYAAPVLPTRGTDSFRSLIQTVGLTALMSAVVAVGIFVLHSPWAGDEVGVLPPPLATSDFDLAPQPKPQLPTKTVIVRIKTPSGACWSGTIDGDPRSGCGPLAQLIDVEGQVNVYLEPESPVDMPIIVAFEVDGRIVQTVGPTTAQYPTINFIYFVPPSG